MSAGTTSGIFRLICPSCGTKLVPQPDGAERCPDCGSRYSVLFGCLVKATDAADANGSIQPARS